MKDFIPYELALKLEEKGFDCDNNYGYNDKGCICVPVYNIDEDQLMTMTPCPEVHEVLKWLREVKRIDAGAVWDNRDGKWIGYINEMDMPDLVGEYVLPNTYDAYEQAAIAGIEYVLNNLI